MPILPGTAGRDAQEAERIQTLLASVPDPDSAARFLRRLEQQSPAGYERVAESPAALRCATQIFSYSNFLSEGCLRDPEALWEASRPGSLERAFTTDDYAGLLYRALLAKQVDLIAGNSTDGLLSARDLAVLDDDKHYFPPYEAVPIARQDLFARYPEARDAIVDLAGKISDQEMQKMNYEVVGRSRDVSDVARDFLRSKNLN